MTFEERLAALGVDLSDLPKTYEDAHTWNALSAAFAWDVMADEKRGEGILAAYVLHLVDIIDRMETRIVNLTGERDYLVERYGDVTSDCRACSYYGEDGDCHNEQTYCSFDFACVPENWRADDD